jgi:hypothetical protein
MAAELVDRLAILLAICRFHGMGAANSRSLRSCSYVRMQHFVRRTTSIPFRRFGEDVRQEFIVLCRRAKMMLRHTFLFLGLRVFLLFFFSLGGLCCSFL